MNNKSIPEPSRNFMTRLGIPLAIVGITFVVLLLASWKSIQSTHKVDAVAVVMRNVETDTPISSTTDSESVIQAPGWVEAEPYSVYAGALTEGVVEEILVLEGDAVKKNQPVAILVSDDAELVLKKSKATERLKTGELNAATALMHELADEYNRKKPLVVTGAVAEGPLERLRLRIIAQEAKVAIASAALEETAVATATAQLALDRCVVVSPIDGIVIERLASPGSVIKLGMREHSSHIVHLYDPTQLQVRADVPLADAARVGVGHPAKIVVDVLPNKTFEGIVLRFVHKADQQKNTIEAKVKILDPSDLLKPDMLARVKILQPENSDGTQMSIEQHIFVPKSAIHDLQNPTVWIIADYVKGVGKAEERKIELGTEEIDGWVEVLSGLSTGTRIITSELDFQEGVLVEIKGDH